MNVRDIYFDTLYDMVAQGEDIVIVSPDLAAPSLDKFRRDFPERYLSVGIAEQNLIQVATGLAIEGKKVIAWGLNPFVVTRALDQIRNTVSLMKVPITIAGLHAGLSSAVTGLTHVVITDLSLIRTCAFIKTINPADCQTAKQAAFESAYGKQALYIRFDKDIIWDNVGYDKIDFSSGISRLYKGKDKMAILVNGIHTNMILNMLPKLKEKNIDPSVINIYTIPFDKQRLKEYLEEADSVFIVEEHILQGGFSSCILEVMADFQIHKKVQRLGIDIEADYPEWFGTRQDVWKFFRLDEKSVFDEIVNFKER